MNVDISKILHKIQTNIDAGTYYPLQSTYSTSIREWYLSQIQIPERGTSFTTPGGLEIAKDYERVVVGDYGAYIEFAPGQIVGKNIRPHFSGSPSRQIKYVWWESKDSHKIKIYEQKRTVLYADYKIGLWYISPHDVLYNTIKIH